MVLTQNQKNQLNKDLLEYLQNNEYENTAQVFAKQIGVQISEIDQQGNKLEIKWKSILTLQKKISNLEQKIQSLEQQLAKGGGGSKLPADIKIDELYIPKKPAKFQMKGHKSTVTSIAFHPQFTQIATSSEDGTIKIWQFQNGDFQRTLKGHTNPVNCLNYDLHGKYLVSCSSDLTIKLWDLGNDYQCLKTFYGHNHNISQVKFILESDYILSCSRDKTIKLWQINSGYCKRTFAGHENWVRRVIITQDNKTIASCSDDQSIIVWNIEKQTPINRFFAHQNVIQCIQFIEGEQSSMLMNAEFLKSKFTQQSKINALKQLRSQGQNGIHQYQQLFILTGSRDKLIKLFLCLTGHDNWVRSIDLHPTGKYFYSASDDKTIRIWDMNWGKEKKKIDAHDHFISTIKFNKKYAVMASSGNDMIIKLWHLK